MLPALTHQTLTQLYNFGLDIPEEIINEILVLPRETVLDDLEIIICDGIENYIERSDDAFDEGIFPVAMVHAAFLLGELRATEKASVIIDIIRGDLDFFDEIFDVALHDKFRQVILYCNHKNLNLLEQFMLEPERLTFCKAMVSEMVAEMSLRGMITREECIVWHERVLEFMFNHSSDKKIHDTILNGLLISGLMDVQAKESLPLIEKMFQAELVDQSVCGDYDEVAFTIETKADFVYTDAKPMLEIYAELIEEEDEDFYIAENDFEDEYDDEYDDDDDLFFTLEDRDNSGGIPYVRPEPKIGRNDKCPCGSGKKYKKCCAA
jgi:hypothetical protein